MSKLKLCPFCEGKAFLATVEHSEESRPSGYRFHGEVMCKKCQASCGTTGFDETKEEADRKAIAAWNRRAGDWTPVSEGDPYEKSCHYLVLSKMNMAHGGTRESNDGDVRRSMCVAYYDCTGAFNIPYVTHWMPLPSTEGIKNDT